jgi:biopolymer transport protein ExbD
MTAHARHELPDDMSINITPLLDVIFQLLVFFLLTSSLVKPTQIEVQLPESSSGVAARPESEPLVVTCRLADGKPVLTVEDAPFGSFAELGAALVARAETAPGRAVDLRIDKAVPYQDVIRLLDTLRDSGFPKFALHTLAVTPGKAP